MLTTPRPVSVVKALRVHATVLGTSVAALWAVFGVDSVLGHALLQYGSLQFDDASWVGGRAPADGRYAAKTRYRQSDAACDLQGLSLRFDEPQWAVTPGQSAVLYDGEVCLGGGVIAAAALAGAPRVTA